ncbi:26855_t:CDS:2 [Gigaspora margarita]|uniref:26855_t:CDS:1 n=1 Tax=Gigaspora margarita TaxID=4874 RepID=A0ABN7WFP1_GIGMA|nr:26855_t:CDS:2 [Gigaspora margarita]
MSPPCQQQNDGNDEGKKRGPKTNGKRSEKSMFLTVSIYDILIISNCVRAAYRLIITI